MTTTGRWTKRPVVAEDIERALVEAETWQSIQAQPYDGERYPCGCHPHPKSPHIHFHLCDYHDGFDEGVYQGQHELHAEIKRLRALVDSVLACDGSANDAYVTVLVPFDLYDALEEARRG